MIEIDSITSMTRILSDSILYMTDCDSRFLIKYHTLITLRRTEPNAARNAQEADQRQKAVMHSTSIKAPSGECAIHPINQSINQSINHVLSI